MEKNLILILKCKVIPYSQAPYIFQFPRYLQKSSLFSSRKVIMKKQLK